MSVGTSVPLTDVTNKSSRAIVGQDQRLIAADHDWDAEKVITSITLRMNITETYDISIYSDGTNGLGIIFVLVHNATTNRSTGLKHI